MIKRAYFVAKFSARGHEKPIDARVNLDDKTLANGRYLDHYAEWADQMATAVMAKYPDIQRLKLVSRSLEYVYATAAGDGESTGFRSSTGRMRTDCYWHETTYAVY